ncbi:MAG: hydrogenase maturation nickel metallochaperone HypA [Candidatus Aminicenantaceae bacterium]|nr:hydrogenase maturation nickel metallochaperone HypA [Candidatus Aminicenantes bacterium]
MHELSIVANLFEVLEEKAKENKAKKILSINLKVGALSGVVPEFLETAFNIYKKDTIAAEAKLNIEEVPLRVQCQKCGAEIVKNDFVFICEKCDSRELKTLSGTELLLEKVEMEVS